MTADPKVTAKTVGTAVSLLLIDAAHALERLREVGQLLERGDIDRARASISNFFAPGSEHGLDDLDALIARSVPVMHEAVSGYG